MGRQSLNRKLFSAIALAVRRAVELVQSIDHDLACSDVTKGTTTERVVEAAMHPRCELLMVLPGRRRVVRLRMRS
jgi:hypothetical protein